MTWIWFVGLVWVAAGVALSILLGRSVRQADEREVDRPAGTEPCVAPPSAGRRGAMVALRSAGGPEHSRPPLPSSASDREAAGDGLAPVHPIPRARASGEG